MTNQADYETQECEALAEDSGVELHVQFDEPAFGGVAAFIIYKEEELTCVLRADTERCWRVHPYG